MSGSRTEKGEVLETPRKKNLLNSVTPTRIREVKMALQLDLAVVRPEEWWTDSEKQAECLSAWH